MGIGSNATLTDLVWNGRGKNRLLNLSDGLVQTSVVGFHCRLCAGCVIRSVEKAELIHDQIPPFWEIYCLPA